MKKNVIIFSVMVLAACSPKVYKLSEDDATRGGIKFPGLTLAELNEGKALYETKCTTCHAAKRPGSKNEQEWRKIVPSMAEASKNKGKGVITEAEQDNILKYVITMASK
jgi:cytochrome c